MVVLICFSRGCLVGCLQPVGKKVRHTSGRTMTNVGPHVEVGGRSCPSPYTEALSLIIVPLYQSLGQLKIIC